MSQNEKAVSQNSKRTKRANGRGSLFEDHRRKGWVASFIDIHGRRKSEIFATKKEAEKWLDVQIAAKMSGTTTFAANPKQTVTEYLENWFEFRKTRIRFNTYESYRKAIKNLISPRIGSKNAGKLKPIDVDKFFNDLIEAGYAGGTIRTAYSTLSKAFNDGVRLSLLPRNPLDFCEKPNMTSKITKSIPAKDQELIYREALKNTYDFARLIVGSEMSLRPGEIVGLRWEDIDQENLIVHVSRQVQDQKGKGLHYCSTKNSRDEPIPISPLQLDALLRHKRDQEEFWGEVANYKSWKKDAGIIFPNSKGNLLSAKSDRIWFADLCNRAGVQKYQRYQMRKTGLTELLLVSDVATVKMYSGHSQASTLLKHYVSPELESVRDANKRREEKLKGYLQ
jgi:integrase